MPKAKHPRKGEGKNQPDILSSISPSKAVMEEVDALIASEHQNPSREQTAEHPTSGGKNSLSSLFPSKKMEEYVMKITRELE